MQGVDPPPALVGPVARVPLAELLVRLEEVCRAAGVCLAQRALLRLARDGRLRVMCVVAHLEALGTCLASELVRNAPADHHRIERVGARLPGPSLQSFAGKSLPASTNRLGFCTDSPIARNTFLRGTQFSPTASVAVLVLVLVHVDTDFKACGSIRGP